MARPLYSLLLIFSLAFVGLMALFGYYGFWSDSEMWAVTSAKYLFSGSPEYDFTIKPLFQLINWLLFQIAFSLNIYPMYVDRIFAALITATSIFFVYRICQTLNKESRWSLLCVVFLVSTQIFLKQGARVRSDIYAIALVLPAVLLLLQNSRLERRTLFILGTLFLASLALTPKCIYHWLFVVPLLWRHFRQDGENRQLRMFFLGSIFLGLLSLAVSGGVHLWNYFIGTFSAEGFGTGYWDSIRFYHLIRFAFSDPQVVLGLIWITYRVLTPGKREATVLALNHGALALCLALVFHPEKLPFFIYSCVPFFAIAAFAAPSCARRAGEVLDQSRWVRWGLVAVIGCLWGRSLSTYLLLIEEKNNSKQVEAMNILSDRFREQPQVSIFDPVGIVPFRKAHMWYLGPGNPEERKTAFTVFSSILPDVVFYTQRLEWLEPQISEMLRQNYLDWGHGVFARRLRFPVSSEQPSLSTKDICRQLKETKPSLRPEDFLYFLPAQGPDSRIFLESKQGSSHPNRTPLRKMQWKEFEKADRVQVQGKPFEFFVEWLGPIPRGIPDSLTNLFRFDFEL